MELIQKIISLALFAVACTEYTGPKYANPYPSNYRSPSSYASEPTYPEPPVYSRSSDDQSPSYNPSKPAYSQPPVYNGPSNYPRHSSYPSKQTYPQPPAYKRPSDYPRSSYPRSRPANSGSPSYSDDSIYSPYSVRPAPGVYPCKGYPEGTTYPVSGVCFAYFQCVNGEAFYQQCGEYSSFDAKSGRCVADKSCITACTEDLKPHPYDIYKFFLGGQETSCPYGTYFDYRICTCQSPDNLPVQYPVQYRK